MSSILGKDGSDSVSVLWRVGEWFPDIPSDKLTKLKLYHDELLKFNKSLNLISVKTIPTADLVHFADSILASRLIQATLPKGATIYDLGSGNGFPGLVFAILFGDQSVIAVDQDQKKAEFLRQMAFTLKLTNLTVNSHAIESFKEETIQYGMCRGLASVTKSLLLARKVFKVGGSLYHLKSEEWASEVAEIPSQLCAAWSSELLAEYKLPTGNVKYSVVITKKQK